MPHLLVFGLELTVKGENDGMQDRSQKRPTIWIVAVALLTMVVLIGILFMPGTDGRWDAMRTRVAKLRDEARSRNVSRPVLRGEPIPGNAWDEYNIALNRALDFKEEGNGAKLNQFNNRDASADRAMVAQLIAAHPGVIDHLRLGAQVDSTGPCDSCKGTGDRRTQLSSSRYCLHE
jgi:hypothetical protein